MSDVTYSTEVDRHVVALGAQLKEDKVAPDSDVIKAYKRLRRTLKKDGFTLAPLVEEGVVAPPKTKRTKTAVVTKDVSAEYVVSAFRVRDSVDATVVANVFTEIDGWKTRTLDLKGTFFVVVTNAPRWSKKRIKGALADLIQESSSASASATAPA